MSSPTTTTMTTWRFFVLCSFAAPAFSQGNGMDMSMDGPMDLAVGNMLTYAHFTPGDTLWFLGWVPSRAGTMVGACVGVFLLAILERWLAACLGFAQRHWAERGRVSVPDKSVTSPLPPSPDSELSMSPSTGKQTLCPSFVFEYDITRGILFAAQTSIKVLLMLAVMTFQLAFLLSIAIGSGVGETLFGRFSSLLHEH